ncbi:MAG TPA: shikimate kinase [Saprospiraceae bacterium]|nr:shikimate kinase [Saprospiraceae bacterium]
MVQPMLILRRHIALVGMPGSGKSTLAKALGHSLGLSNLDLDEWFERRQGCSISEFWERQGESAFRVMERLLLLEVLTRPPMILALGGGTPAFFDQAELLRNHATVVYLKAEVNDLARHMEAEFRPMFRSEVDKTLQLRNLLSKRKGFYQRAHMVLEAYQSEPILIELVSKFCRDNGTLINS